MMVRLVELLQDWKIVPTFQEVITIARPTSRKSERTARLNLQLINVLAAFGRTGSSVLLHQTVVLRVAMAEGHCCSTHSSALLTETSAGPTERGPFLLTRSLLNCWCELAQHKYLLSIVHD
jgi:hypothetical protein